MRAIFDADLELALAAHLVQQLDLEKGATRGALFADGIGAPIGPAIIPQAQPIAVASRRRGNRLPWGRNGVGGTPQEPFSGPLQRFRSCQEFGF
jgi:hypothetical protein